MDKSTQSVPSKLAHSARNRWLVFSISAALATGGAYWVWSEQTPQLREPFVLPRSSLSGLPQGLSERVKSLENQIREGHDLIQNLSRLGGLAHASGLPDIATACWTQLASIEPTNAHWPYYLADLARARRDDATELAALQTSQDLDPQYAPIPLHLANLHFRQGNLAAARHAFERRLKLKPNDPHARLGLARIAQREGKPEERFALLQEIVKVAPEFPSAHNLLAAELTARGDVEGARKHRWLGHSAGRWTNPADPWLDQLDQSCFAPNRLYVLTTRDYQLNRPTDALKWMQRAAELRPGNFAHLEFVGDLYIKLGDPQKAIKAMNRALALEDGQPPTLTLFINLAEAYRQLGQHELAINVIQDGLKYHPEAVELHNSLGVSLSMLGDKLAAMNAFQRAIELQPFNPDANFNLGYTLLEQGEETAGIEAIRRSLVQQPTFGKALTFLGQYELSSGDMVAAKNLLERLYDAYWGIPDARRLWAEWHFKAGALASSTDENEAESLYRAGLRIDDSLSDLHLGLGALLVSQNRTTEAIEALKRVQQLDPDDSRGFLYMGQALLGAGKKVDARQQLQVGLELATLAGQAATAARCRELLRGL